jgi:hypothetical protein
MSKGNTIVVWQKSDGTLVQVLPDGTTRPRPDPTDWARVDAMTEEQVHAAAMADPDARPMTPEEKAKARRVPRVRTLRRALGRHRRNSRRVITFHLARCAIGSRDARSRISRRGRISK